MQNFSNQSNLIAQFPNGNYELGEAFSQALVDMVIPSGVTNLQAESYDVVSPSWKKLANKPDKSPEENKHLNDIMRREITDLAESYMFYISKSIGNFTGKLTYVDYENFMLKTRFAKSPEINNKEQIIGIKAKIKNAFDKISAHGETSGDDLIDKQDMAIYLYALVVKMNVNRETKEFKGFYVNGAIEPREYAVNEAFLFEDSNDNFLTLKLQIGYNFFYGINKDK